MDEVARCEGFRMGRMKNEGKARELRSRDAQAFKLILLENWRAQTIRGGNLRCTSSHAWERGKKEKGVWQRRQRVAKFSQPLRNDPVKFSCSTKMTWEISQG